MSLRRGGLLALGCAAAVFAFAYADLVLRARSAYLEGEKYMLWHGRPELKRAHFEEEARRREERLRRDAAKKKMTPRELEQRLELIRFERDERIAESSLKYAVVWYQTVVDLFTPPESRWVSLSRQKLSEARELWKQELDARKIPYEPYMLE